MAANRLVKPFIVAGLTGALSIAAPVAALAEDAAAADVAAAPTASAATQEDVRYEIWGVYNTAGECVVYSHTEWPLGANDYMFQLHRVEGYDDTIVTEGVTFSSSNPGVLWVDSEGLSMKTGDAGTATVTAYLNGVEVAHLDYTVIDYVPGDAVGYAFSGYVSDSRDELAFSPGVRYELEHFKIAPVNASGEFVGNGVSNKVVYSSSDETVFRVNEADGYVEALKPGTADLIATVYDEDGVTVLGTAKLTYTVSGYEDRIDQASVYEVPLPGSTKSAEFTYDDHGQLAGISYDLANGAGFSAISLFQLADVEGSNVTFLGCTTTSSNEGVVKVVRDDTYGVDRLEFVGVGTATVTVTGTFSVESGLARSVEGETRTVTRTVEVTVTDSSQGGQQTTGGQTMTDEQKADDTSNKKDTAGTSDGEGLPETGDAALAVVALSGLAGVGAVAAGVRSRRRGE